MAVAELKNCDNIGKNVFSRVFGAAVYKFLIRFKIQNGGFTMAATRMESRDNIGENINLGDFRGH